MIFPKIMTLKMTLIKKSKAILHEIDEINSKTPQLISQIEGKLQIFSSTKYIISKS